MKKTQYKIMFRFIKNIFIGLLGACTKVSFREPLTSNFDGHIKFISLSNRPYQTHTIICQYKI